MELNNWIFIGLIIILAIWQTIKFAKETKINPFLALILMPLAVFVLCFIFLCVIIILPIAALYFLVWQLFNPKTFEEYRKRNKEKIDNRPAPIP